MGINWFTLIAVAVLGLAACQGPGDGAFKLASTGAIGGNGIDVPLAIEDGGVTNGLLANSGISISAMMPLVASNQVALGGTLSLSCPSCLAGMGTVGAIPKFTSAAGLGASGITEDVNGNVGIGTTTRFLTVDRSISIASPDSNVANSAIELIGNGPVADASVGHLGFINRRATDPRVPVALIHARTDNPFINANAASLVFETANAMGVSAERLRVTSAGKVGIATDKPESTLHVGSGNGRYLQIPVIVNDPPPAQDCDGTEEMGRMVIVTSGRAPSDSNVGLWVCVGFNAGVTWKRLAIAP